MKNALNSPPWTTSRPIGMLRNLLIIAVGVVFVTVLAMPARAATLVARSFPLTGEIRLENPGSAPVPIVFSSMKSTTGSLNPSPTRWISITEHYDAPFGSTPGNGFIDPIAEWMKISATSMELTEGAFSGPGGNVPAKRSVSLGRVWNSAIPFDLSFAATEPNGQPISVFPATGLDGDYDGNGTVNQLDYLVWRAAYGTVSLAADGNLNGIVDAADYAIWRNNVGLSISGTAAALPALGNGAAVPEPSGALLVGGALVASSVCRKRVRCRLSTHRQ